MTEPEIPMFATDEEMERRIRPLVNEILDRFNAEDITPAEAGMVILAMIYRLMGLLEEAPEARRFFILTLINLINNFLAGEVEGQA
jgi:hypothetical protein